MSKWFVLIVLAGALGAGGYWFWQKQRNEAQAEAAPTRPTTAPVIQTNIDFAVNAAGEIGPADQVSVRPQVNGIIKLLPVDIGDVVKKDAILFTLDDQDLQTERSTKLIEIEAAKLQQEKAERDFKRSEQLVSEHLISQELFEDTKTTYELAKNLVEQKSKELHLIEYQITLTKILAPFDCTVLTRPVSVGQAVSGSGGFNSGTEVLTIADLNSMIINAHVNQADVPRLRQGQSVEITVEAVPGLKVNGVVERIAPQATIKNNIKGFATRVALKNVDPRVRPGMTANVRIPVASAANVTAVPLAAVFTERNPETDQMERFVYVQQGDGFEKRNVKVGVSDYFYAEIQGGLTGGEIVSLELPKDEREKKARQLATQKPAAGAEGVATTTRPAPPAAPRPAPGGPATDATPKPKPATNPAATGSANTSSR